MSRDARQGRPPPPAEGREQLPPKSARIVAAAPPTGFRRLMMRPDAAAPAAPAPPPRAPAPAPVTVQVRNLFHSPEPPTAAKPATAAAASQPPPRPAMESTPDSAPLWSGRIRAGDEVGRGAMGYVLRGTDTKLRRELALKVTPHPRDKLPTGLLARFVEEAQITAQLEHPNVVPVHDLGVDPEGHAYFSMKLVRGQSLEEILEKRRAKDPETLSEFGLRRLLDVFLQVCQGVDYAHARGVIHRDLKPANIMVGDFGEVLVMDWGLAKLKGRAEPPPSGASDPGGAELLSDVTSVRAENRALATQHGAVLGTPAYMSPEQAKGMSVDERADVYALGVILYEILCGDVPFDSEDPLHVLSRLVSEAPRPPSKVDPSTPLALEALALRLLEKDPERRNLSIPQIRSLVQDYIEGIGHEYRRESLWTNALWFVGGFGLFAFLVWYLTGQSIATVVALTPPAVFNAIGWLLVVMAAGYPLWGATTSFRMSRAQAHERFRPATSEELFVSGYLAHRTFAAALAPLFQLIFIVEVFAVAVSQASRGEMASADLVSRMVSQLRAEWAHALIVILVFLFAYLFLLSTEVRFARRVDRYVLLVRRPAWETVWPFFLIVVLVSTVVATDVLAWTPATAGETRWGFLRDRLLAEPLQVFEMVKTLVFQGTFLLGLVAATILLAFPFAELLASLRMAYQPADEASVKSRQQYFLRSMAVFQIAGANWLYGGAMIGSLTAVTVLSEATRPSLVEQVVYILGPSLIGFIGFTLTRRYAKAHLANAPAVRRMLAEQIATARDEHTRANLEQLRSVSWRSRLVQVAAPVACIVGYLLWTGSGIHQGAIRQLIIPVSTEGWLRILPYALLVPLLLVRDPLQHWILRRRARISDQAST
jgi:hypothetical protein